MGILGMQLVWIDDVGSLYVIIDNVVEVVLRNVSLAIFGLLIGALGIVFLFFLLGTAFFFYLLYEKFFYAGKVLKRMSPDLSGKVAIVTGATSGVGRATAEQLAEWGAHVIIAVRDPIHGMEVTLDMRSRLKQRAELRTKEEERRRRKEKVKKGRSRSGSSSSSTSQDGEMSLGESDELSDDKSRVSLAGQLARRGRGILFRAESFSRTPREAVRPGHIEVMVLDLGSLSSVRAFARRFYRTGLPLHILVNNAGIMWTPKSFTQDGFEKQFGVNFLSHFLLTRLLADVLRRSGSPRNPSRVVSVSSVFHHLAWDVHFYRGFRAPGYIYWRAYAESKAALAMFSEELGRRLNGTGVVSHAVNPGAVRTRLFDNFPWYWKPIMMVVSRLVFLSPLNGAEPTLWAAAGDEPGRDTGLYYSRRRDGCRAVPIGRQWRSRAKQSALWESCILLTQEGTDESQIVK